MAWVKIDDNFAQHPKVARVGPLGMAMQIAALCYCNRHLTDGFLPKQIARILLSFDGLAMRMWDGDVMGGGQDASWELVVEDLVAAGLWEEADDGWMIHDYLKYQPSRMESQILSGKRSKIGRRGGLAKSKQNPSKLLSKPSSKSPSKIEAKVCPVPVPVPVPQKDLIYSENPNIVHPEAVASVIKAVAKNGGDKSRYVWLKQTDTRVARAKKWWRAQYGCELESTTRGNRQGYWVPWEATD